MQVRGIDLDLFGRPVVRRSGAAQMALPLKWRPGSVAHHGDFLVSHSNALAAQHIQGFGDWHSPASILAGPPKSGKSLLGAMFRDAGAGDVIDTLAGAAEADVFHAWNRASTNGRKLLIIVDSTADVASVELPDLRTRLATAPVVSILEPDHELATALVQCLLAERGLAATGAVVRYVADRIDHSYAAIHSCVDAIDHEAMASGRPLGVRLVHDVLIAEGFIVDAGDKDGISKCAGQDV